MSKKVYIRIYYTIMRFFTSLAIGLLTISSMLGSSYVNGSSCICTTVQCPMIGVNTLVMGGGVSTIHYKYIEHNGIPVVSSAEGIVPIASLDKGTDTTDCTQKYSRMLEDDGSSNCDAGHIMANRLGGYGNQPINIFPQQLSVNRGAYAQFEDKIYHCIQSGASQASLSWLFTYRNTSSTMPSEIHYNAVFDKGECTTIHSVFTN